MPTLPLPRPSLASLPRLLRTPPCIAFPPAARCATPLVCLQRAPYARDAQNKHSNADWGKYHKRTREISKKEPLDATGAVLKLLREACAAANVRMLLDLYPGLIATKALHPNNTRSIARAVHARARDMSDGDTSVDDILTFADRMVRDIQAGDLETRPEVQVHLLGIYKMFQKHQEGYEFWQWLVDKGDSRHVNQAVYGAAIELFASGDILSLDELEDLYADALKRFPGVFAEYHLSPGAIVPDRSQPVATAGLPITLLQGILTARVNAHDWRNSYLALDTALRLLPTKTPKRFLDVLINARPLPEAYTAFLVACRAGVGLNGSQLTSLIKRLRSSISEATLSERVTALRAMANAMYAYVQAGRSLEGPHYGVFIRSFEAVIPPVIVEGTVSDTEAKMRSMMSIAAHEIVSTVLQAGMPPHISIFLALLDLAGKYKDDALFERVLQDIHVAQNEQRPAEIRAMLNAAGWLGDQDMIEAIWNRITSEAETRGEQVLYEDWVTLVRTCGRAGHTNYYMEQYWKFQHMLSEDVKTRLAGEAEHEGWTKTPHTSLDFNLNLPAFTREMDALRSQMRNVATVIMSGEPLSMRENPFYMSLDPARPPLGSPEDLRTVYDEMTTDPYQPEPPRGTVKPVESRSTRLPLDELRFENWVSITEMMTLAKLHASCTEPAPFGGHVLEGQPLGLEALRKWIYELRVFGLRASALNTRRPFEVVRPNRYATSERRPTNPTPPKTYRSSKTLKMGPRRCAYNPLGIQREGVVAPATATHPSAEKKRKTARTEESTSSVS